MSPTYPDLAGRRVLVTGASSGIGHGIARAFLAQGARVAAHGRTGRDALAALVAAHPGRAHPVLGDLADEAGCRDVVAAAVGALGGVDVLVHSAGVWRPTPIASLATSDLDATFRTNTYAAFWLVREVLPAMPRGAVLLIGSTAGRRGEPGHAAYAASKAALRGLVMSLAQELAPAVRINLLSPGWVRTPMAAATLSPAREAAITAKIPDGRLATVEDCAQAALFLCSDASSHLVGVDLDLSGGALLPVPAR